MSSAYFLIPGARLAAPLAREFLGSATRDELDALALIGAKSENPVMQAIAPHPFERAPHYMWLWRVLARKPRLPASAPALWVQSGGPGQDVQIWTLSALAFNAEGTVSDEVEIDDERMFFEITMALARELDRNRAEGLRLQTSGRTWFVTRRADWDATAAPARALVGERPDAAHVCGPDAEAVLDLQARLNALLSGALADVNETLRRAGRTPIGAFWLHGGGRDARFFPPTTIRSVAADDPVALGWANAAGILRDRLGTTRSRRETLWPDAPEGDLIVLLEELYDPWLRGDLTAWRRVLPELAERLALWREAARMRHAEDAVTVLFGSGTSATLTPKKAGLLSLLQRSKSVDPTLWLSDDAPHEDSAAGEHA